MSIYIFSLLILKDFIFSLLIQKLDPFHELFRKTYSNYSGVIGLNQPDESLTKRVNNDLHVIVTWYQSQN